MMKTNIYSLTSGLFFTILTVFLPSHYASGGYGYGFPLNYLTIYQSEPASVWLFPNFFTGNSGLSFDIFYFAIDVLIIFALIRVAVFIKNKVKSTDSGNH